MAQAIFDGAGNLTNIEELTVDEVATAYAEKNKEIFDRAKNAEAKEKEALALADKAKQDLEAVKSKVNPKELEDVQDVKGIVAKLALADEKRNFGYENNLSPEETDKVFQLTGNKPSKEVLEDSFVKGGIDALRNKKRLADNTPGPSSSSASFAAGKDTEQMTPAEKQAEFDKFMAAKNRK